jgi:hypothetical protein
MKLYIEMSNLDNRQEEDRMFEEIDRVRKEQNHVFEEIRRDIINSNDLADSDLNDLYSEMHSDIKYVFQRKEIRTIKQIFKLNYAEMLLINSLGRDIIANWFKKLTSRECQLVVSWLMRYRVIKQDGDSTQTVCDLIRDIRKECGITKYTKYEKYAKFPKIKDVLLDIESRYNLTLSEKRMIHIFGNARIPGWENPDTQFLTNRQIKNIVSWVENIKLWGLEEEDLQIYSNLLAERKLAEVPELLCLPLEEYIRYSSRFDIDGIERIVKAVDKNNI